MKKPNIYTIKLITVFFIIILLAGCSNRDGHYLDGDHNFSNMDDAIGMAIKSRSGSYALGETATEGHIILGAGEKDGTIRVYTIASYGAFGFENGIFTKVSGSGAIPTVITFSKDEDGDYALLEYKEPMDGLGYIDSIKKMFPKNLHKRILSNHDDYSVLAKQQESQAEEYLKSIGRTAVVSEKYVEKELLDINVEASNRLFTEFTKDNSFLNDCPYWIGTREKVEDGVRYVYETSLDKTDEGYDLVIFQKKKEGTVVKEHRYRIVGSKPELVK